MIFSPDFSLRRRRLVVAGAATALTHVPALSGTPRQQLSVAAFPLVDEILRNALPAWQRRFPDVAVQVVSRPYADHHTAMTTALSTSAYLPDVMALETNYLGRFSQGKGLDNLMAAPYNGAALKDRFVRYTWDQAVNRRGELVGLPTDIGPGTLLYRADLFEKARLDVAALQPSWEAFVAAGAQLKAATGAYLISNVIRLKDILIRSGLKAGEGLYFDGDSNALITTPRFVRAFELAREARQRGLDARTTEWTNEWAEGFKRGTLATDLTGAWMVGQLATWVAPDTRGRWRAAQLPGETYVSYGGTFYASPRRSAPENQAAAWALIQLLTLDRDLQLSASKAQDAFPALLAAQDDPFFEQPLPFLGGQQARLLWRSAARRITATAVHKQASFAEEVVNTELANVLTRGKSIPQALGDAQRLIERRAFR